MWTWMLPITATTLRAHRKYTAQQWMVNTGAQTDREREREREGLCVKMAEELVAHKGRLRQRYDNKCRLVAGYKKSAEACDGTVNQELEVLMISSRSSEKKLLFPKVLY